MYNDKATFKKVELDLKTRRKIPFIPELATIFDGVKEAIYFAQLYYWLDKGSRPDGFIYKSKEEIKKETYISPKEQDRIRKKLMRWGVLEIKIHRANGAPTLHYRTLPKVVNSLLQTEQSILEDLSYWINIKGVDARSYLGIFDSYNWEEILTCITQDITQEKTTENTHTITRQSDNKTLENSENSFLDEFSLEPIAYDREGNPIPSDVIKANKDNNIQEQQRKTINYPAEAIPPERYDSSTPINAEPTHPYDPDEGVVIPW